MHAILLFWVVVASYVAAAVAAGLRDKVVAAGLHDKVLNLQEVYKVVAAGLRDKVPNLQEVLQKEAIANGNNNCPLWVGNGGW